MFPATFSYLNGKNIFYQNYLSDRKPWRQVKPFFSQAEQADCPILYFDIRSIHAFDKGRSCEKKSEKVPISRGSILGIFCPTANGMKCIKFRCRNFGALIPPLTNLSMEAAAMYVRVLVQVGLCAYSY